MLLWRSTLRKPVWLATSPPFSPRSLFRGFFLVYERYSVQYVALYVPTSTSGLWSRFKSFQVSTICEMWFTARYSENLKQIFPEMELRGLSPNSYIDVTLSDSWIPTIVLPILPHKICRPIMGIYCINRSQIHELEIWTEAAQFLFWKYKYRIFFAVSIFLAQNALF